MDKASNALALGTSPIVRALIDPEGGMQDIRCVCVCGGERTRRVNPSGKEWGKG